MLETSQLQGFMWEREWRYANPDGLFFDHRSIKIICCPKDEEREICDILGEVSARITFIRAWQEYDDITDYLQRQHKEWRFQREQYEQAEQTQNIEDTAKHLEALIKQYTLTLHNLESYESLVARFNKEADRANQEKFGLNKQLESLQKRLNAVQKELQIAQSNTSNAVAG